MHNFGKQAIICFHLAGGLFPDAETELIWMQELNPVLPAAPVETIVNKGRREKHFHTRAERAMKSISKLKTGVFIYNLKLFAKIANWASD